MTKKPGRIREARVNLHAARPTRTHTQDTAHGLSWLYIIRNGAATKCNDGWKKAFALPLMAVARDRRVT